MKTKDRHENNGRKSHFNPDRETYMNQDGNYVYLIWDTKTKLYHKEVCVVGVEGFTPEIRDALDDMDAEEDRLNEKENRREFEALAKNLFEYYLEDYEYKNNPLYILCRPGLQPRSAKRANLKKLNRAMKKLNPEQINLIYEIYGEMKYGADVAREQGVSRQAINNRIRKIQNRLKKLMGELSDD